MSDTFSERHREHVLRLFRATMPGVAGVVLSSTNGEPLAHDMDSDPTHLARSALAQHQADGAAGASTLVPGPEGLYLVVFVPPGMSSSWSAPALPA